MEGSPRNTPRILQKGRPMAPKWKVFGGCQLLPPEVPVSESPSLRGVEEGLGPGHLAEVRLDREGVPPFAEVSPPLFCFCVGFCSPFVINQGSSPKGFVFSE